MLPRILSIEGNIGAGKSTLIREIKEKYKDRNDIYVVEEPVDIWERVKTNGQTIIEKFYQDKNKYSFPFQVLAYTTRLNLIKDALKIEGVKTIIMERSLEADRNIFAKMLYDDGFIEESLYQIYEVMSDLGLKDYSADGIVWLDTEPDICIERIKKRNREGEESISIDYLNNCDIYHKEWLSADLGFVFRISNDYIDWDLLEKFINGHNYD
jgi:deoxyadenosine/deoxycytidine kinase